MSVLQHFSSTVSPHDLSVALLNDNTPRQRTDFHQKEDEEVMTPTSVGPPAMSSIHCQLLAEPGEGQCLVLVSIICCGFRLIVEQMMGGGFVVGKLFELCFEFINAFLVRFVSCLLPADFANIVFHFGKISSKKWSIENHYIKSVKEVPPDPINKSLRPILCLHAGNLHLLTMASTHIIKICI